MALVEEYQHALSVANVGGIRDLNTVFDQLGLRSSPQVSFAALHMPLYVDPFNKF